MTCLSCVFILINENITFIRDLSFLQIIKNSKIKIIIKNNVNQHIVIIQFGNSSWLNNESQLIVKSSGPQLYCFSS